MENTLNDRINLGKDTRTKLARAGIDSFEKLQELGSEQAFLRLQAMDPGACLSLLYGLEGAILGVKWHALPALRKQELQQFFKSVKPVNSCK